MHPSQTRETAFNRDEGKHGQREKLESRDIRQIPTKRRVEVQSQNRDLLIRDLCLRLLAGSHGFRGTPWTRSSTPFLGYRRSMVLCR